MKKKLCSLLLAVTLLFNAVSLRPQPAHAFVTSVVVATNPIVGWVFLGALVGFGFGGALAITGGTLAAVSSDENDTLVLGLALLTMGIMILDQDSGAISFGPLSPELIAGAGLNANETEAYALERPELNRALFDAAADMAAQGVTTAAQAYEHQDMWLARTAGLLPETRSALAKVRAYLNAQMNTAAPQN